MRPNRSRPDASRRDLRSFFFRSTKNFHFLRQSRSFWGAIVRLGGFFRKEAKGKKGGGWSRPALRQQQLQHRPIGTILMDMGAINEEDLEQVLSAA